MTAIVEQDQQKHGSGRPQVTITKDTTLKISLVMLISIVGYAAFGTWQFLELRGSERERVNAMLSSTNSNVAQLSASVLQQLASLTSDLSYTSRGFEGYKSRFDRVDDNLQEIRLLRHRIDQLEQSGPSHERRVHAAETKIEEAQRRIAELSIVTEYLMRWLNPPGADPPKKRNETSPFRHGNDENPIIYHLMHR